jgi:Helix-turn-helix family
VTPELAAASAAWRAYELDTAWSTDPETLRRARSLEVSGWAFYVAGRGGVLGDDVAPEAVAAAIGVVAPDAVRAGWEAARRVGPAEVARARLEECARWGDERLGDIAADGRLPDLAERVVAAVDPVAMPLFAATRAIVETSEKMGARAALRIHLLREHRAAAMLIAVRACGLTAREAIIAGPEGEREAITFGWAPPFPARVPLLRRYAYADALANRIAAAAFTTLEPAERADLVDLLTSAAAGLNGS